MKTADLFQKLPSVAELLETPRLKRLVERVNQSSVATSVRSVLDDVRVEYQRAKARQQPSISELAERIARRVLLGDESRAQPVINATGMLLDPVLVAPPLAEMALDQLVIQGQDYSNVRFDLLTGSAANPRDQEAADLLVELTGASAAMVVNSFSGAIVLAMSALAAGKEVVVARSQVICMSSGERLIDLLAAAGVTLKEVGASNRIELADYAAAIGPQTGCILVVLPAQRQVVTLEKAEEVSLAELGELARRHQIPLTQALDCATLLKPGKLGLPPCLAIEDFCASQADLVLARGEGLVGGPESGLILGQHPIVQTLHGHRLSLALEANKLMLAALTATLRLYRDPAQACLQVPLLALLATSPDNLRLRAESIAAQLAAAPGVASAVAEPAETCFGGGLAPFDEPLRTWTVRLRLTDREPGSLEKKLRLDRPTVFACDRFEFLEFDLRSVLPRQDIELVAAVKEALN